MVVSDAKATLDVLVVGDEDLSVSVKRVFDDEGVVGSVDQVQGYLMALGHLTMVTPKALVGRVEGLGEEGESIGRALRRLAPEARMILLATPDREALAAEALAYGFDEYVIEPVASRELMRVIRRAGRAAASDVEGAGEEMRSAADSEELELEGQPESGALFNGHHEEEESDFDMREARSSPRNEFPVAEHSGAGSSGLAGPGDPGGPAGPEGLRQEDLALVEHLLEEGRQLREVGLRVISQQSGLGGVQWAGSRVEVPTGRVCVDLAYQERGLGVLHAERSVGVERLKPWAGWMARWLALGEMVDQLWSMALRDDLTGAWNQRYFNRFLKRILERAQRERFFVTVVVFDIDDFRAFNKLHGRAAGDEVLQETARWLKATVREQDVVARVGDDEFAVVLWDTGQPRRPNSRHPHEVGPIARRFQQAVDQGKFLTGGGALGHGAAAGLTFTAGIAGFPWNGRTGQELVEQARQVLEQCRREGEAAIRVGAAESVEATSAA